MTSIGAKWVQVSMEREDVIQELGKIAFAQASDASGAQVKLASKLRALELLAKHFGLFEKERQEAAEPVVIVDDLGGVRGVKREELRCQPVADD